MASLALIADAQAAGTWRRLKTCRNPRCEAAFHDRSRNNSGTWPDRRLPGGRAVPEQGQVFAERLRVEARARRHCRGHIRSGC
ncbi:CGNR zinc finger domain-containing protein [Amycolatopsis balhimycina DSM 5908]|uniref:CGNR zinc finger domain-containing protein n=1 Tax=Amycolatopsis balhimycina DSM 5908 TaxID=1081091 RepID=A0A428W4B6_AMYBA|nr:CGNR zinc finger domain-containing protein [Amycolatopsis balhimycina]RSM37920.1 CGNR zinc finger domain-containing protein [Amycolatopsis balhimycina DSM 5908]